jgi:hypothetical protein
MFCPACPLKPVPTVHYTYAGGDASNPKGMVHHWRTKHPGLEFPSELVPSITRSEQESVDRVGKEPPKKRITARVAASSSPQEVRATSAVPATPAVTAEGEAEEL